MDLISGVYNWQFLNEPAYRWFIFVAMMVLFLVVMGGILRHM
jgi:hypothetical protein